MMSPRFWIYCVICCCCRWFADPWWVVGFNLITASDSSYVLGYSYLIMAHLGWVAGPIIMFLLIVVSFYNNCLLGSLHETGGKRQIRTRDLAHYIYGTTTSSARAASSESSPSKKWIPCVFREGKISTRVNR